MEKELKIRKIKNGTVIDHLPPGSSFDVMRILGIDREHPSTVSVIMNVASKSGKKDIVKVEERILKPAETNKLSLIAPHATINIIRNYTVVKKNRVTVPDEFKEVIKCANPNCITNQEEPLEVGFVVEEKEPIRLRCKFCERIMEHDLIEQQL